MGLSQKLLFLGDVKGWSKKKPVIFKWSEGVLSKAIIFKWPEGAESKTVMFKWRYRVE